MYEEFMGGAVRTFCADRPFTTDAGTEILDLTVAYHTYGTLNAERNNAVWVCHALTANSDCADWWPGTVVEGGLLDPAKYFVVCANKLGSCYGSSRGVFTVRDNVRAFSLLANSLHISNLHMLIGSSTGGAQAMEWAIMEPDRVERLALLATLPAATAWTTASSEAQRMAIRASADKYDGLAAARAISMLLYRGENPYNITQTATSVVTYQQYQGAKLAKRFDPACYMAMLHTLDTHDVGRDRGGVERALGMIKAKTVVISFTTDIMFPPQAVGKMAEAIPQAKYYDLPTEYGHDGFLIETPAITEILKPLMENNL